MFSQVRAIHRVIGAACGAAVLIAVGLHERHSGPSLLSDTVSSDRGAVVRSEALLMGTTFVFTLWAETGREAAAEKAIQEAVRLVHDLEGRISEWRPDSETSAVNAAAGTSPVTVSEDTLELSKVSVEWAQRTEGAFDVTGGPLLDLWNRARKSGALPAQEEIRSGLELTGYNKVEITGNTICLKQPGMRMGFGGIGKGFAADRVAALLKTCGFPDFIVDAGGDLVIGGSRGGAPWDIAIRHPRTDRYLAVLRSSEDCAVATSGDYENYVFVDGVRYSHIVDLRTGMPARNVASVTIFARRGVDADALATGLSVLGVDAGLALANALPDVDALLIEEAGTIHLSDGLRLAEGEVQWLR